MPDQYEDFRDDDRETILVDYVIKVRSKHMRLTPRQKEVMFNMIRRAAQDIHIKLAMAVGNHITVTAHRASHSMGQDDIDLDQVVDEDDAYGESRAISPEPIASSPTSADEEDDAHHRGEDG